MGSGIAGPPISGVEAGGAKNCVEGREGGREGSISELVGGRVGSGMAGPPISGVEAGGAKNCLEGWREGGREGGRKEVSG